MAITISRSKLLLVEGTHEVKFFNRLLETMQIDDVQVEPLGGKYLFKPNIKNLPGYPGFSGVTSIGIVRDANANFEDTFRSVLGALRDANLPAPGEVIIPTATSPQVAIFITPDNGSEGALEDLLMACVQGDPVLACVDGYFDCLRGIQGGAHPHLSKAQVQVYLAKEPEGDVHMGIASERNVWVWDSSAFDGLKTFIRSLFSPAST
jgi:hypothetical protein